VNKENKIYIGIFLCLLFLCLIILLIGNVPCLFKTILKIQCPGCGMTRALKLILKGQLIASFNYNILTLPLVIILIILCILAMIDIIKKTNLFSKFIDTILGKYYYIVILLLLLSLIINIHRGI